jgi:recombination protein RecR
MQVAYQRILTCSVCGNIDTIDPCTICQDTRRDPGILLIVETVSDLWALERARLMPARYHVLGGVLSPLDGVGPDDINITKLLDRIREGQAGERNVREAILAVNATVDGQTTAHYIADLLAPLGVKTTRLAHGVPVGGELDYLDEGTLAAALERRTAF